MPQRLLMRWDYPATAMDRRRPVLPVPYASGRIIYEIYYRAW